MTHTSAYSIPENYQASPTLLQDRVIIVSGAGSGLGRTLSLSFAAHGASVVLLGRTISKLEQVYDEIEDAGYPQPAIYPINFEGAVEKDYIDLAITVEQEFGRIDGLVNNAALLDALTPIEQFDMQQWYKLMQVNLHAPVMLTQACLKTMRNAPDASIVFVTDHKIKAFWGAYGVSKYALQGFGKILAEELENATSIRINCIDPGPLRTPLRARAYPAEDKNLVPAPESVVNAFLYLMGPDSISVTGKAIQL